MTNRIRIQLAGYLRSSVAATNPKGGPAAAAPHDLRQAIEEALERRARWDARQIGLARRR